MSNYNTMNKMNVTCDYCGKDAALMTGKNLFPHRAELSEHWFYACDPCGAHVGCHPGTELPLGRLANAELRSARQAAHVAFDPLWKCGQFTRTAAYRWLADQLNMDPGACHIGRFDCPTCSRVVAACQAYALQLEDTNPRP